MSSCQNPKPRRVNLIRGTNNVSDQPGDSLLRQLGQLARERDAAEADTDSRKKAPRDTLAEDSLAEDSLAEDSLAEDTAPPGDWERQAAKPLDAKAQQRIVRRLEQVIAEEFPDDREKGAALQNSTGPPTAFRARAKRLPAWLAWPAAAALLLAVSLFALRVALGPRNVNQEPNLVADLPTYSMTVEGLTRFQRGSQEDPEIESPGSSVERKEIALGNQLRVTLTPGEGYSGSLKGRAFFSCEGPWQQLPDEVLALSAQGALRL